MVYRLTPVLHIILVGNTGLVVSLCLWNALPVTTAGHTNTADTSGLEIRVSVMIPNPVFHRLTALFGLHAHREVCVAADTVAHGSIPFVISLHPSEIGIRSILITEQARIGSSAINRHIRDTVGSSHSFLSGVGIGQQPGEMRRILILFERAIRSPESVDFD